MKAHRSSLPVLPNLAKIIFYDSQAPQISEPNSVLQKSPLRSSQISKRLKILNGKSTESPVKAKKVEDEGVAHSPSHQYQYKESKMRPSLVKLGLKIDYHVKTKDLLLPKKQLPKLYTHSMYKKYSEKVTELKDKYANNYNNSLVNLSERDGGNGNHGNQLSLRQLVLKTEEQIHHSYSIKYLGVKDEGIGILSRRVPISQLEPKYLRSKSTGRPKEGNEKAGDIVNIPRKGSHQIRTKEISPRNSMKESYVSSLKQLNSEESLWDIERRLEKEHQQYDIINELEENKSVDSQPKQAQEILSQQKHVAEMHQLKDNLFIKEGYKEVNQAPLDFTKLYSQVEEKSTMEQELHRQNTLGDETPIEPHTSCVVNKFGALQKLQSMKKKNHISPQKGSKPVQMTSERLNREVYMMSNYASFERQVTSLHKLKSRMLGTRGIRSKSNIKVADISQNTSAEVKPVKKEPHKYSYAKLLSTMYTQENAEMDLVEKIGGKNIAVQNTARNVVDGESELEKEDSTEKVEEGKKREKRSQSQCEMSNRDIKAQLGAIKAQMRQAIKLL